LPRRRRKGNGRDDVPKLYRRALQSAGSETIPVFDKYTEEPVARVAASIPGDVDAAVSAAEAAFQSIPLDTRRRLEILREAARLWRAGRTNSFAGSSLKVVKTVAEATREVTRAIELLGVTAEETARIVGELVPLEGLAGGAGKLAFTMRNPLGVICAITPFNSPLNTPIHKLAPAIAAGNTVVLKPASQTPVSALLLGEIFAEAGLPAGWLNVVTGAERLVGEQLMRDRRIAFYHFTGSTEVGAQIASHLRLRRSSLELGASPPQSLQTTPTSIARSQTRRERRSPRRGRSAPRPRPSTRNPQYSRMSASVSPPLRDGYAPETRTTAQPMSDR